MNKIKNVNVYGNTAKSGVVSFTVENLDSSEVSNILDEEFNIATRSGLHCAPLVHKFYGTTKNGMTRVSLSYFNSKRDILKFVEALKKLHWVKCNFFIAKLIFLNPNIQTPHYFYLPKFLHKNLRAYILSGRENN